MGVVRSVKEENDYYLPYPNEYSLENCVWDEQLYKTIVK